MYLPSLDRPTRPTTPHPLFPIPFSQYPFKYSFFQAELTAATIPLDLKKHESCSLRRLLRRSCRGHVASPNPPPSSIYAPRPFHVTHTRHVCRQLFHVHAWHQLPYLMSFSFLRCFFLSFFLPFPVSCFALSDAAPPSSTPPCHSDPTCPAHTHDTMIQHAHALHHVRTL